MGILLNWSKKEGQSFEVYCDIVAPAYLRMNILRTTAYFFLVIFAVSCGSQPPSDLVVPTGAMMDAMHKGELASKIDLDTLPDKSSLYGLGPLAFMRGEILVLDGQAFVSRVDTSGGMKVRENFQVGAPFFVRANVRQWTEVPLPSGKLDQKSLEEFIIEKSQERNKAFAFKLQGKFNHIDIHVQNLPEGAKVSSPQEAHQGQTSFLLGDVEADILGFFSKEHQGVFTHHDSFVHMHLITKDRKQMGHLDEVEFDGAEVSLYFSE